MTDLQCGPCQGWLPSFRFAERVNLAKRFLHQIPAAEGRGGEVISCDTKPSPVHVDSESDQHDYNSRKLRADRRKQSPPETSGRLPHQLTDAVPRQRAPSATRVLLAVLRATPADEPQRRLPRLQRGQGRSVVRLSRGW